MKKRLIASIIAVMSLFSLSFIGCNKSTTKSTTGDTNSGKTVTVKFGVEATAKELIEEFEKANPGIKVEVIDATGEKLLTMLAAGTAPDIIRVNGVLDVPSLAAKGIALNIDEYIKKSSVFKSDDLLPIVNVYRFDGKNTGVGPFYGLPKDWSQDTGIFINKKVFQNSGVPVPDIDKSMTYNQLFDLGKQLTKFDEKGKMTQIGLSGWFKNGAIVDFQTLLYHLLQ
jgi:multiple sugar transport system substrate-binding protein